MSENTTGKPRPGDIVEDTGDRVLTLRPDGAVESMNAAAREAFGPPPIDIRAIFPSRVAAAMTDILVSIAAAGEGVWSGETRVIDATGREHPVSLVAVAARVAGGAAGVLLVLRDLTDREREREQVEAALLASEESYRDFTSAAADWVWEMGPDLRFRNVSPRVEAFTGLSPDEFIGRSRGEVGDFRGAEDVLDRHLADLAARREFRDFSYRSVASDGGVRWYETSGRPVYDAEGRFAGYRGISRDVTVRERALAALRESEHRFRSLIEGSLQGIFIHHDFEPLFVNQAFADMLGYDGPESILAMPSIAPLFAPGEVARMREYSEARLAGDHDAPAVYEFEAVTRDGRSVFLQNTARRVQWEGQPAVQAAVIDITERRRAEVALRASEARFRALYDDNPSTYLTLDSAGVIRSINRHGASELGHDSADLVGVDAAELYPPDERAAFRRFLAECLAAPERSQRWELPRCRADGSLMWVRETARSVRGSDGESIILVVSEDASEARNLSEQLAYEASHDMLTGLFNRREFEARLARVIDSARDHDSQHALCYLDLDQFKIVNDTCGHMAGDELLRQLGVIFGEHVRRRDTLARLGGDEFALLIEHCPYEQAMRIAGKMHDAVQSFRFRWEEHIFRIGVSIGVVPIDAVSPGADQVLGMADQACYVAKDQGRNRVHAYRADDAEISRRTGEMQWIARLGKALDRGRLTLVRQRIAPVRANVTGNHYELLVRMVDDDGSLIGPGAFLPAAERYDLATRLDRWVLAAALDWLSASPGEREALYLCAINLSGQSLGDDSFLDHALSLIRDSCVPPDKLCFEITETAAIVNFAGAHRFIVALRELGCHFALDDFGSGLSSFGYLKSLPVDFLKIDGSFVRDIADDPIDQAMVEAINRIGQVIGKRTIAEFVESEAILERLRDVGVDFAQGYHIGPPERFDLSGSS